MNKKEFLSNLERGLEYHSIEERGEILSDFEGFFEEALLAGKDEEHICQELGDPAEIAERIGEESAIFSKPSCPSVDTDALCANMSITLYSMNLKCSEYEGSDYEVIITKAGRVVHDDSVIIKKENGSLDIRQPRPDSFVNRILSSWDFKTMHIKVPSGFKGNVSIRMVSGNCTVDALHAKDCKVELRSGNIRLDGITALSGLITATSGNIHMNRCAMPAVVVGRSGNIDISFHKGSVSASTISGNNYVETDCISAPSKIETRSGNLRVKVSELKANLEIQGHSGNINLTVGQLLASIYGKTTSGNIKAYFNANTNAVFSTASSQFKNEFHNTNNEGIEVPVVNLYTKSGTVKVKRI